MKSKLLKSWHKKLAGSVLGLGQLRQKHGNTRRRLLALVRTCVSKSNLTMGENLQARQGSSRSNQIICAGQCTIFAKSGGRDPLLFWCRNTEKIWLNSGEPKRQNKQPNRRTRPTQQTSSTQTGTAPSLKLHNLPQRTNDTDAHLLDGCLEGSTSTWTRSARSEEARTRPQVWRCSQPGCGPGGGVRAILLG